MRRTGEQRRGAQRPAGKQATQASGFQRRWQLWRPHIKRFLPGLLVNHGVTVAVALTFAVIVGIGSKFSLVPSVLASVWMIFNAAPLRMQGVELGFVPLVPAMAVILGHSRRITKTLGDKISVRGLRVFSVLALLIPLLLTCIAWLMLWDAGRVFDVQTPNLGIALLSTFLVNGLAVVVGMRGRIWRALLLRRHWPTWPVESVRLAGNFLGWMCVAGLLGLVIAMIGNWSAVTAAYEIAPGFWAGVGLTLLALLYLPNMAIGAAAVLMGGEFNVGHGLSSLFNITNVQLPPLPVLAAVPNAEIPGGPFLLAIPAIVSIGTVYRFIRKRSYLESPLWLGLGSGVAALVLAFIGAWLSRGELGTLGTTGPVPWLAAVEAAGWLVLPAIVLMWFLARDGVAVTEGVPADQVPAEQGGDAAPAEEEEYAADTEAEAEDADTTGAEPGEAEEDPEGSEQEPGEEADTEGEESPEDGEDSAEPDTAEPDEAEANSAAETNSGEVTEEGAEPEQDQG